MRGGDWTGGQIELLRRLWAEGETAAAIAARLGGMSRSAVLGKVFRLRLGVDGARARSRAERPAPAQRGFAPAAQAPDFAPARRRAGGKRHKASEPPPTASRHKSLLELKNESCRWPNGRPGSAKFFFCSAPGADLERGIPYCPRHMRRAYSMPVSSLAAASPARPAMPATDAHGPAR